MQSHFLVRSEELGVRSGINLAVVSCRGGACSSRMAETSYIYFRFSIAEMLVMRYVKNACLCRPPQSTFQLYPDFSISPKPSPGGGSCF